MARQRNFRHTHLGMTLVELLMVVAIMTVLLAVAVPMVRPAFKDRVLREAARQVNTYFASAKARAAENGRSVGVWIERQRDVDGQLYATQLSIAEVAPVFTGATLQSRATVVFPASVSPPVPPTNPEWPHEFDYTTLGALRFWTWNPLTSTNAQEATTPSILMNLVADLEIFFIRFDHKGPFYSCIRYDQPAGTPNYLISIPNGVPRGTEDVTPGSRPVGQSFEIMRGPSKSIVSPLTLPGDAVLDLTVSGVGLGAFMTSFDYERPYTPPVPPPKPVVIMFTPGGQVGYVYVDEIAKVPTGPLFLMVGRRAKLATPATPHDPEVSNLADGANLWITINNRTGAITTEDNAPTLPTLTLDERIVAAREFARGSRQKGGR